MKQHESLITVNNVTVSRSDNTILSNIDLTIHAGEIVSLIGPNGAGKTTLVRGVLGLLQPDSGSVSYSADLRIGYMPQRLMLNENMPLTVKRFLLLTGKIEAAWFNETISLLGIEKLMDRPMQKLSGGENQRVLLAKAILRNPQLLVLDEPVQGVDVTGQSELYGLISTIRDRLGCGVLMVSHDLHLVMASTDHVLCINRHLCCSGHPETISRHPAYLELFGLAAEQELAVYSHHHDHNHDMHGNVIHGGGEGSDG